MGNLYYHRVSPSELEAMVFTRLKYWNGWYELIENEKAKTTCKKCKKTYDGRTKHVCM